MYYLADQCHAPYGIQPMETILAWSTAISDWFVSRHIRVVVIACNSASAAALYNLRERFPDVHFVGMEPAVKPACLASKTGRVAVLATPATLTGAPYKNVLKHHAGGCEVFATACPMWVDLVETPPEDPKKIFSEVRGIVQPLLDDGVDQLILGCTHFSFLKDAIETVCRGRATVVDPAVAVARQAERIAISAGLQEEKPGECRLFTTGDPVQFQKQARALFEQSFTVASAWWE